MSLISKNFATQPSSDAHAGIIAYSCLQLVPLIFGQALSHRNLEEMMEERGVRIDHTNIYRWVQEIYIAIGAHFRKGNKRPVGKQLEDGLDLHQNQGSLEAPVSCR